jgi:hypothetical protein
MPRIALSTFLKYCLLSEKQKASSYRKYLNPGEGYDFYWSLKKCVSEITFGGHSYDHCMGTIINPLRKKVEQTHNAHGLRTFVYWLGGRERTFFAPPEATIATPKGYLSIRLKPEFGIVSDGERQIVSIWNTRTPDMTPFYAGVGIYLLEQNLCEGDFSDCKSTILDVRKHHWFRTDRIPATVPEFIEKEFVWIDKFFEDEAKKKAA